MFYLFFIKLIKIFYKLSILFNFNFNGYADKFSVQSDDWIYFYRTRKVDDGFFGKNHQLEIFFLSLLKMKMKIIIIFNNCPNLNFSKIFYNDEDGE
jgi:hypothetical protein